MGVRAALTITMESGMVFLGWLGVNAIDVYVNVNCGRKNFTAASPAAHTSSCGPGTMGGMKALAPTLPRLMRTALLVLAGTSLLATGHAQTTSPTSAAPPAIRTLGTPDFAQIVQRYGPAVVNISVSGTRLITADSKDNSANAKGADSEDPTQLFLRKFQEQFGATGASMQIPVSGRASGFIVSADGLVLTNAHVIAHATEETVNMTDRREFTAKELGRA